MDSRHKEVEPKIPVFDGHNDTLLHLYLPERGEGRSFFEESGIGHIDLPRARKGGLAGGLFGIYTPPPKTSPESNSDYALGLVKQGLDIRYSPIDHDYARKQTNLIIDFAFDLERKSGGRVKIIRNFNEIEECFKKDILAMVLHIEGAEAVASDLSNLEGFYRRGVRSLGLTWSRPNAFGTGVSYGFPRSPDIGPGLTNAGKELVRECNRLGIMIDLSHLNENGFWDVARLSGKPLVATHSNAWALSPTSRNLTDKQIDSIGASGGLIGVNFVPEQVNPDGKLDIKTPLTRYATHIDYIAGRIGTSHVALGSDFDGAKMPDSMRDVTRLPDLIDTLKARGYDGEQLKKIAYKNWLRVLGDTWRL